MGVNKSLSSMRDISIIEYSARRYHPYDHKTKIIQI